jgi:hypothetical protein
MKENTGFKELLNKMMSRRWYITALVLGSFIIIIGGIFAAIMSKTQSSAEWKELLLLMLGAFIGSYGKIIDYWFSDTDKDKMLVQKMDEEDGISLSNTQDIKESTPVLSNVTTDVVTPQVKVEIDEDGDGTIDGYDIDGDGKIDEYFDHRNCQHVWGDVDGDGDEECVICGVIKPIE